MDSPLDPAIEILTRGRRARSRRLPFPEQKAALHRLVRKAPEALVKVSGGGKTTLHVMDHLSYITRNGALEGVTENGEKISSREELQDLLDDWGLDLTRGIGKNKLAFNLVLSMPAGTPPDRLHSAAQDFAREQFWQRHQYVMVLHTPDNDPHKGAPPHPHVHLCVKAEDYDGKRLYIRKATLEQWRQDFAEKLRGRGIEAKATPRDIRGQTRKAKKQAVYFAEKRGQSRVTKAKVEEAAKLIRKEGNTPRHWEIAIAKRRAAIVSEFGRAVAELRATGDHQLAAEVEQFAKELPLIETERQAIQRQLIAHIADLRQQKQRRGIDHHTPASTPRTYSREDQER